MAHIDGKRLFIVTAALIAGTRSARARLRAARGIMAYCMRI